MTQEQYQWLLNNGYDPSVYDVDDEGNIFTNPVSAPATQKKMSAPRAFGTSFAGSLLPSAVGLGGAKLGMMAGAPLGPVGIGIGALAGGLGAGYLAGKGQEAALESFAPEAIEEMQRAQTDQPVASYLGGFAPNALAFRPSLQGMSGLLRPTVRGEETLRAALSNPNFIAPAANVAANVGASTAGQLINVAEGGEFSAPRFAADVALGTLFNRPTALGRRIGFADLPEARPVESPELAPARERAEFMAYPPREFATPRAERGAEDIKTPGVNIGLEAPEQYFTAEGKRMTEKAMAKDYTNWWKSETEPTIDLLKGAAEEVKMKLPREKLKELSNDPEVGEVLRDPSKMEAFVAKGADQALEDVFQMLERRRSREFATAEEAANQKAFRELQAERGVPTETQLSDVEAAYAASKVNATEAAREVYTRLQRPEGAGENRITQQDIDFAAEVAARRGLKIELDRAFAGDQEVRGMYFVDENGNRIIRVNPLMATPDTAIHEIGHDIFTGVTNKGMRRSLLDTALDSPAYKSELAARLKEGMPEAQARDIALEEGLIQAFGEKMPGINRGELRSWFRAFKASMKQLFTGKLSPEDALAWMHYASTEAVPWKGVAVGKTGEERMQRAQQETPEFKNWFGESKIVDAEGKPLVVYHGTSKDTDFTSFKNSRRGLWFTTDPAAASSYATDNDSMYTTSAIMEHKNRKSRVLPVYIKLERPYKLSPEVIADYKRAKSYRKFQQDLTDTVKTLVGDYDGIDWGNGIYTVFNPEQVKSATANRGTFSPESKDIRYQRAQQETPEFKSFFGASKVVDEQGKPKFVYHGTGADITQFEKGLLNERSLYGPGIYLTESADVAGGLKGYSFKGLKPEDATAEFSFNENVPITEQIKQAKERAIKEGFTQEEVNESIFVPGDDATIYMHYQESWQQPNVMPLYAKIENPFDIDVIPENWSALAERMDETATRLFGDKYLGIDFDSLARAEVATHNISNRYLYDALFRSFERSLPRKAYANQVLQAMGYDGITHTGGLSQRYGSGKPHKVWIAFEPEQIKSALGNRGTFSPESSDIRYQRGLLSKIQTPSELDYLVSKGSPFAEVGTTIKAAANTRDFKQGQWSSKYSLTNALPEEARVRLLNHLAGEFDSGVRSTPAADIRAAYDQLRNEYLPAIVNDYNTAGFMVRDTAGLRARGSNPTYFPLHAIADEVTNILTTKQGSPEWDKLKADFINWNTQLRQADGASLAEAQRYANEKFDEKLSITAKPPGIESGIPFSGARKPEGYPLPPSWRSNDIIDILNNYTRRSATDFAYQQHVESSPVAMAALGAKTMLNNQPIPAQILQSTAPVINDPSVQSVLREYRGTPAQRTEGTLPSIGRFVSAATIGPVSKTGDIGTSMFKGLAYLPGSEYASGLATFTNKIADWAALKERSYASGLNKRDAAESMRQVLGIAEDSTAFMDKAARVLSKATFVNDLESVARVIAQGWGETIVGINKKLALGGDKNATQMLDTLTPDWRTRSDADLAAQVGRLLQGSYDMRQLPASVLEGAAAPYLTWSKWSMGQYDSFMKYALRPAMQGNMKPLIGQMVIGLLGGGAISAVQEWLNNREGKDITWRELESWMQQNQGELGADGGMMLGQKLLTMAQKMGTFGFAGDLVKMTIDAAAGGTAQGVATMPAMDAIYDTTKRAAAALKALDDGEDFGLVAKALVQDSLTSHLQVARVARNWLDEDENLRYDDRRRQRLYDKLMGLPSKGGTFAVSYSNLSEREFERGEIGEGTGEEALALVTRAREEATTPEDYASRIRKYKTSQNQIMPSMERQPMKAARYLSWLEGTEEGLGSETMRRYMTREYENKYRKSLIEGLSGLR